MERKEKTMKRFIIYDIPDVEEEEIARAVTAANAVNLGADDYQTLFFDTAEKAKEAIV